MKMDIFWKQSARSGMATFIRMACAFAVNKFLAVVAGPVGFAIVGQLQNLLNTSKKHKNLLNIYPRKKVVKNLLQAV